MLTEEQIQQELNEMLDYLRDNKMNDRDRHLAQGFCQGLTFALKTDTCYCGGAFYKIDAFTSECSVCKNQKAR